MNLFVLAVTVLEIAHGGIDLKMEADRTTIDPGRDVILTVTMKSPAGTMLEMPALRDRVRGFSLAEDFEEESLRTVAKDGSLTRVVTWRLVPQPCADEYRIAPIAIGESFWTKPIRFDPAVREPVTGDMELDPKKDLPPLSWKLVGYVALALALLGLLGYALFLGCRYLARRIREHRMSPIERAWAELDRLLAKGLPGRGRYKDFYVELTMVVRRYIQRKYGIKAPNLTTEEFFAELARSPELTMSRAESLREFLSHADLIKFAGVEADPEMADEATASAKSYLKADSDEVVVSVRNHQVIINEAN